MINKDTVYYTTSTDGAYLLYTPPKKSGWTCYMFGSKPGTHEVFLYAPSVGNVPNFFVRWMMKICLGCTWVKK